MIMQNLMISKHSRLAMIPASQQLFDRKYLSFKLRLISLNNLPFSSLMPDVYF